MKRKVLYIFLLFLPVFLTLADFGIEGWNTKSFLNGMNFFAWQLIIGGIPYILTAITFLFLHWRDDNAKFLIASSSIPGLFIKFMILQWFLFWVYGAISGLITVEKTINAIMIAVLFTAIAGVISFLYVFVARAIIAYVESKSLLKD